jgi:deoxyribodipyrimidine photo-lyase
LKVLPLFIFDENITNELPNDDHRVNFIYSILDTLNNKLNSFHSSLLCLKGNPLDVFKNLIGEHQISAVYYNNDYEPYAIKRDKQIDELLQEKSIDIHSFKDHVIFEKDEITKADGKPYKVFTPYKNKWLANFNPINFLPFNYIDFSNFAKKTFPFPLLSDLNFEPSSKKVMDINFDIIPNYHENRGFPSISTSNLSPHIRFGTISCRQILSKLSFKDSTFMNELIWREFFIMILFHFPHTVDNNFKAKYDRIDWRNNEDEFKLWCQGKTGYPFVDAGMRELNETGYMHNRVRMITAGFLCKHLLIDWRWGEAYFAKKLFDFDLSANVGNWQWASGTGCDAAPYFRIFNPKSQVTKFDKDMAYVKKWIPELMTDDYPLPVVDHKKARERALETYSKSLNS